MCIKDNQDNFGEWMFYKVIYRNANWIWNCNSVLQTIALWVLHPQPGLRCWWERQLSELGQCRLCQLVQSAAFWPGLQERGFCICQGRKNKRLSRWESGKKRPPCYLRLHWLGLVQELFPLSKSLWEHWPYQNNQHSRWLAGGWVRIVNSGCSAGENGSIVKKVHHEVSSFRGSKCWEAWVCDAITRLNAFVKSKRKDAWCLPCSRQRLWCCLAGILHATIKTYSWHITEAKVVLQSVGERAAVSANAVWAAWMKPLCPFIQMQVSEILLSIPTLYITLRNSYH